MAIFSNIISQLVKQNPQKTAHFGEMVPRIIVQEPTSITNAENSCLLNVEK